MKIKDLDPKIGLRGTIFRYPGDGKLYYWYSQWQKGVWGKKSMADSQVFPLECDDLKDALEWDVETSSIHDDVSESATSLPRQREQNK